MNGTRHFRSSRAPEAHPRERAGKLAFFTGRDPIQALIGLWAQLFGTPNWAAHGGFCSVNMAAAGAVISIHGFVTRTSQWRRKLCARPSTPKSPTCALPEI